MGRIKRFLKDDSGSAEATSSVILIAGAAIFLAVGVAYMWPTFQGVFTTTGDSATAAAGRIPTWF